MINKKFSVLQIFYSQSKQLSYFKICKQIIKRQPRKVHLCHFTFKEIICFQCLHINKHKASSDNNAEIIWRQFYKILLQQWNYTRHFGSVKTNLHSTRKSKQNCITSTTSPNITHCIKFIIPHVTLYTD